MPVIVAVPVIPGSMLVPMTVAMDELEDTYAHVPADAKFAPPAPVTVGGVSTKGASPKVAVAEVLTPRVGVSFAIVIVVAALDTGS